MIQGYGKRTGVPVLLGLVAFGYFSRRRGHRGKSSRGTFRPASFCRSGSSGIALMTRDKNLLLIVSNRLMEYFSLVESLVFQVRRLGHVFFSKYQDVVGIFFLLNHPWLDARIHHILL